MRLVNRIFYNLTCVLNESTTKLVSMENEGE